MNGKIAPKSNVIGVADPARKAGRRRNREPHDISNQLQSALRDRVGYFDHDQFRGYVPVHSVPAYNLPVYASQWPLPDITQDLVRGCSLGFAAAAISGDGIPCACKAQLPHHRAYGAVPRRFGGLSVHQLFHGRQAQTFEARIGEGAVQCVREAQSPWAFWAENGLAGRRPKDAKTTEFMIPPAARLPLDPGDATQAPSKSSCRGIATRATG